MAALKADAHRPREHRRTAKALLVQLQAQGYRGGYTTLTDFIRLWRADSGKAATRAFVPLSFEYGEAFQFDWSEEGIVIGGVYYRAQVAHLKLCASRAFWLVAYPARAMKCCSMPTPVPLLPWAAWPRRGSTNARDFPVRSAGRLAAGHGRCQHRSLCPSTRRRDHDDRHRGN